MFYHVYASGSGYFVRESVRRPRPYFLHQQAAVEGCCTYRGVYRHQHTEQQSTPLVNAHSTSSSVFTRRKIAPILNEKLKAHAHAHVARALLLDIYGGFTRRRLKSGSRDINVFPDPITRRLEVVLLE